MFCRPRSSAFSASADLAPRTWTALINHSTFPALDLTYSNYSITVCNDTLHSHTSSTVSSLIFAVLRRGRRSFFTTRLTSHQFDQIRPSMYLPTPRTSPPSLVSAFWARPFTVGRVFRLFGGRSSFGLCVVAFFCHASLTLRS